jgi:carbon monoxide dehydrogenase subunit G
MGSLAEDTGLVRSLGRKKPCRCLGSEEVIDMTVLRKEIEVPLEPERAFDRIADFSTSAEWDPGVVSARRIREGTPAPSGVGAEYRLTVTFRGRESDMTYRTTEFRRPSRIVLEGEGPRIAATDTIGFEPSGSGTRISYVADLRLTGLAKIAEPFLGSAFEEMGDRALSGMRSWLSREPQDAR